MKKMTAKELRKAYLQFFANKNHTIISSASLIPENDPTVLFTTAGMHPLVPYLLGEKHPGGNRLANVQKCVRTGDIDDVGDATHCTFFEMLGNWSLGDYFKKEAINFSFEFLTKELQIPIERIAVSVFEGDNDAPRDDVSAQIWADCGIYKHNIFYLPKKNNWWGPAGKTGPCGPDTEMFVISLNKEKCSQNCSPACDCGRYVEIWNDVFMEYFKDADANFSPLAQKNVDTGMGLERTVCMLNGYNSVYDCDVFSGALSLISEFCGKQYDENDETTKAFRIIADHMRTAVFIIGDSRGVTPGNVNQGYVLRRLIRRAVRFGRTIGLRKGILPQICENYVEVYKEIYPELLENREKIVFEVRQEEERFFKTVTLGLKEFEKVTQGLDGGIIDGRTAFRLYDTFGFPIEMTVELAKEKGLKVDTEGFDAAFSEHQKKSQADGGSFKGGLSDNSEAVARLHTATHLLQAALIKVLGGGVEQRGSNITAERLRFDFSFARPMTEEEIAKTQSLVNGYISTGANIICEEMSIEEAKAKGAIGLFESRYGEKVKVYSIGNFSVEICGGPHAKSLLELGKFEIQKEQSSSSGVRRIRAVLA